MCLPFDCCQKNDHGGHHDTRPSPTRDLHGDGGYPYGHPVGVGKNGAQGRAAAGVNMNGAEHGAAFYNSDSEVPASVGFGRKGPGEKMVAPPAAPVVSQTPQHWVPKTMVPSPTWGAPAPQAHVAAGARHHGRPVAASQPKQGATATTQQTAPVPQVARRDDDDYSAYINL